MGSLIYLRLQIIFLTLFLFVTGSLVVEFLNSNLRINISVSNKVLSIKDYFHLQS